MFFPPLSLLNRLSLRHDTSQRGTAIGRLTPHPSYPPLTTVVLALTLRLVCCLPLNYVRAVCADLFASPCTM